MSRTSPAIETTPTTRLRRMAGAAALLVALALAAPSARAGFHSWRIDEVFSSEDGRIQFVELKEISGLPDETRLSEVVFTTGAYEYAYPHDLVGDTSHKRLLMATQAFADLPGAPPPDYIIPENFFDPNLDVLLFSFFDLLVLPEGILPTDGVSSLGHALTPQPNSPTNFAGQTGTVSAAAAPVPLLPTGVVIAGLALLLACATLSVARGRRAPLRY